jgi:hypothetical protein
MGVKGVKRDFDAGRRILKYMRERPGQDIHYSDVAEATNSNADNTCTMLARTVQRHPEFGITRRGSGTYRYIPVADGYLIGPPTPEPQDSKLYEVLGFMDDSVMVVRDDEGQMSLWRKVEL